MITPSHNPPEDGGFKYNPPSGGPADTDATSWIENRANALLAARLEGVSRLSYREARRAGTTHRYDFRSAYVDDLGAAIDFEKARGVRMGVDPLGGAGVAYWDVIAERYRLDVTVVNRLVDPTFRFMTLDWDGKIRMDCSSPFAMAPLIGLKDRFDVAFANDTDNDRHGVVTRSAGLLNPNHYLAAAIDYLFSHRPSWSDGAAVGKTLVTSSIVDRIAERLRRPLVEVPVGFKWFVSGLLDGSLGFGGEESAGASFLRRDGTVWTTDKDGLLLGLLAAEMMGATGRDPGEIYARITSESRSPRLRAHRLQGDPGAKGSPQEALSLGRRGERARGRPDSVDDDAGAGKRCPHRRSQSHDRPRLVRGAAFGDRGRLQALRRELSGRGPSASHPVGSAGNPRKGLRGGAVDAPSSARASGSALRMGRR